MPKKLATLTIEEVSLVDLGANQLADIKLWKRAPTTTGTGAQVIELKKELPVAEPVKEVPKVEPVKVEPVIDTLTTDLDSVQKRNAALEKELDKVRTELRGEIEIRTAELEASKAETEKLRKQRRRERFIKRAEELDYLPGAKADDFAEPLDLIEAGLAATIPDRAAKVFGKFNEKLTSWNAIIEKNDVLFREIGREGGDLGMLSGVEAQLEVLTKEVQAGDPKLSHAQAYDRVLTEHPQLYRKYQAEQSKGAQ